jgi:hypothetical protein
VECGEKFCAPSTASLVTEHELVDFSRFEEFNSFQMEWRGSRFEIYEGNFPDLNHGEVEQVSIPVDANAEFSLDGQNGRILARLGDGRPRFLGISVPCGSRSECPVLDAGRALSLR